MTNTNSRNNTTESTDDFNPDEIVKEHDKDIGDIKERLITLEDKLGTNERIADTLYETADKQTKMHEMIATTFVKVLKTDDKVKNELKAVIDDYDRNKLSWLTGKIGVGIWSVFLVVLTFILTKLFGN